jgi:hypothetical protein
MQAVMCTLHRNVGLSDLSIVEIQRLVSNHWHLSNEDYSYLQVWTRPYQPKLKDEFSVPEALRKLIMRPLEARDHIDGFPYILCDEDRLGKVKIGFAQDIARRVSEWDRDCKRTHRLSLSLSQHIRIPHSRRVARLIITELREFRVNDACEGCGVIHSQWFAVEEAFAVKVLQKWQNWVAQKPYVPCDGSDEWRLRPEMLNPGSHHEPIS